MAILIEAKRTTIPQKELINGFIEGWIKAFNEVPKKESIGVLFAQTCHETGLTKSLWNYNLGNHKFVSFEGDDNVKYIKLSGVWEIIGGKKIILDKENPGAWFRAFDTLADGVAFHLESLKNKRFKNVWVAVEAGDPKSFAHLLKLKMYYTDSEENYFKGMKFYFDIFMKDKTYEEFIEANKNIFDFNKSFDNL